MRTKLRSRSAARATAAAAMAAALLSVSCWLPLFDPEVSASEKLAKRLGRPILSFTMTELPKYFAEDAWFVPDRTDISTLLPVYGMLVRTEDTIVHLTAVGYYSNSDDAIWYSDYTYPNSFGNFPKVIGQPGAPGSLQIISNKQAPIQFVYTATWDTGNPFPTNSGILGAGSVSGSETIPDASDNLSWCYVDSGSGYVEYETMMGYQTGYFSFNATGTVLSFPSLYYFSDTGTFLDMDPYLYLSCGMSDGSWAIFRWEKALPSENPVRYPAVFGPLIAGLSDGRLLAFDGITTTVLSPDMKKLFSFPSGKLRFVHERYDATLGYPICVFTRTVFLRKSDNDDRGEARIEIFEIPTSRLGELGS